MIYELRTYQLHAGKAPEFLKIYEENGLAIISRYAKLIGCWTKELASFELGGFPLGVRRFRTSHAAARQARQGSAMAGVRTVDPAIPGPSGKRVHAPGGIFTRAVGRMRRLPEWASMR